MLYILHYLRWNFSSADWEFFANCQVDNADFNSSITQVYEMMKEIDNHRRTSAKKGNYLAADAAAQRLLELKVCSCCTSIMIKYQMIKKLTGSVNHPCPHMEGLQMVIAEGIILYFSS